MLVPQPPNDDFGAFRTIHDCLMITAMSEEWLRVVQGWVIAAKNWGRIFVFKYIVKKGPNGHVI